MLCSDPLGEPWRSPDPLAAIKGFLLLRDLLLRGGRGRKGRRGKKRAGTGRGVKALHIFHFKH